MKKFTYFIEFSASVEVAANSEDEALEIARSRLDKSEMEAEITDTVTNEAE